MAKIKSIFGNYVDQLQLIVDRTQDRFAPTWYQRYFNWAPPQIGLTYTSIIGASRIEAAASVVSRDSETPLRARGQLSKMSGEIPAIREMYAMTESEVRDYESMRNMPIPDAARRDQILDMIFNDVLKVGNSVFKRLDILCLEAVSTGKITLTTLNNPDGIVLTEPLDLMMPEANKRDAAVTWTNSASATPLKDIQDLIKAARSQGRTFAKIQMVDVVFEAFRKSKEVVDTMTAYYYGPKPGGSFNPVAITVLDNINNFMKANRLPEIEIVEEVIGIEADGKITTYEPFSATNAVFIPAGPLGSIKNAIPIEQIRPVEHVSYATRNRALISKWGTNVPYRDYTKAELNAFPSVEAIDNIYHLKAIL